MKAILKNYRQSPRKVRLVADSIKGKKVEDALLKLKFMPKRATEVIEKLIASALANAKENFDVKDSLFIQNVEINQGVTLKRYRPRARGSAYRINKRTSNIIVTLADVSLMKPKKNAKNKVAAIKEVSDKKVVKKVAKKSVKKVAPKADK
ncbi:MAG: large subunit ribosomal protein [Patescibacteria group bacterium]|nr:large subunit ribosomal protein [Patescibacteria group bacterium]